MKEQSPQLYIRTIAMASAVMATAMVLLLLDGPAEAMSSIKHYVIPLLIGAAFSLFSVYWTRLLNKNPVPLKVALIGPPRCGKTVFLTVLFRELQAYAGDSIRFEPYGVETIETVTTNLRTLSSGRWLEPTSEDSVFFFRANAVLGGGLLGRKYTVEIGDHAGEKLAEFDPTSEQWLHRTSYFDYAVSSDIVFLAVDGDVLASGNDLRIEEVQLKLLAALQMLIEKKGVVPGALLRAPVALLVLKSDVLENREMDQSDVKNKLTRLIQVCERRCLSFETFFVSSIGRQQDLGPQEIVGSGIKINPMKVVDPMVWALRRVRIG